MVVAEDGKGQQGPFFCDAASQLTRVLNQGPGASPITLSDFAYTYDAVGNRTTRTTTNGIASYTYDTLNRLTQARQPDPIDPLRQVTEAFTYDPVGNRTASHLATGQVHDAANRLLEDSQFTYAYDANGNLISKTAKTTGAPTTYTYDAENRLTRVQTPTLTATYRYDPLGRRIAKEVTQAGTPTIIRYLYDQEDILLELDGANTLQARYTHGPGIDEPLIMLRQGQAFFYHADGLGSVWDLTDAAGTVPKSYTYDSFGNLLAQPGAVVNPYTYTGREVDAETGLYYYRARYYEPAVGRFLQEDPLFAGRPFRTTNPASRHVYVYADNNPATLFDPLGLQAGGRGDCSYYDARCNEGKCGDTPDPYACQAGECCRSFGEGLIDRCVRKCLMSNDADCTTLSPTGRGVCRASYHVLCYVECFKVLVNIPRSCLRIAGGFGL